MALARLPELRLTLTIHLYGFVRVWANSAYSWGACGPHTRKHSQRQTDPCHAHLFRWKNWLYHWEKATPLQVVTIFVRRKSTLINYLGAKSDARQGTVETELWRLVSFSSALANDIRRSSHLVCIESPSSFVPNEQKPFIGDCVSYHLVTLLIRNCPHISHETQRTIANPLVC